MSAFSTFFDARFIEQLEASESSVRIKRQNQAKDNGNVLGWDKKVIFLNLMSPNTLLRACLVTVENNFARTT